MSRQQSTLPCHSNLAAGGVASRRYNQVILIALSLCESWLACSYSTSTESPSEIVPKSRPMIESRPNQICSPLKVSTMPVARLRSHRHIVPLAFSGWVRDSIPTDDTIVGATVPFVGVVDALNVLEITQFNLDPPRWFVGFGPRATSARTTVL